MLLSPALDASSSSSSSRALEDFHTSYMSAANWMSVYKWTLYDKGFIRPIKSLTSPRPNPALEVLSTLTACYRRRASLPVGNYPSVFLCFITSIWPPQDAQTKWGIWICLLIRAAEHLRTNTVVICLATRAHNRRTQWVPTHASSYYTASTV